MVNNKAQEMSIQTVVVLILIMIVLVVVVAFAVPQLTGMFGGLGEIGGDVSGQLTDSEGYECVGDGCEDIDNRLECISTEDELDCSWSLKLT